MTLIVPSGSKLARLIDLAVSAWVSGWLKLVLIVVVIGGGFWWFRLWLNKHDDRIFQDGKNRAVETMAKDYETRLKVGMAEAKAMSDTAAEDRAAVEAQIDELDARFALIFGSLREIKVLAEKRQVVYVEKISTIPPSQLDASLRAVSNDPAIRPAH
jgi:hypothetical protein